MKRAYTIERNELICDLFRKGKTIPELCESFHLGCASVKNILKENGINTCECECSLRGELITRLLLEGEMGREEIARTAGVAKGAVAYYVKKLGLPKHYSCVTKQEIDSMLQARTEQGLSNAEIAERHGRSVITVNRHIGKQPAEISRIFRIAGIRKKRADNAAHAKARRYWEHAAFEEKRKAEELARIEAERIERERIEALRAAKEAEIRELLSSLGIPSENFTIDSVESGDAFLNNLITRATEKLSVGA